ERASQRPDALPGRRMRSTRRSTRDHVRPPRGRVAAGRDLPHRLLRRPGPTPRAARPAERPRDHTRQRQPGRPATQPTRPTHTLKGITMNNAYRRELVHRSADGIEVRLYWQPIRDSVAVEVHDAAREDAFEIPVPRDRALDAFHHPFAYAASLSPAVALPFATAAQR